MSLLTAFILAALMAAYWAATLWMVFKSRAVWGVLLVVGGMSAGAMWIAMMALSCGQGDLGSAVFMLWAGAWHILLAPGALVLVMLRVSDSARRAGRGPRCANCDYDLHGLPGEGTCPECGAPKGGELPPGHGGAVVIGG